MTWLRGGAAAVLLGSALAALAQPAPAERAAPIEARPAGEAGPAERRARGGRAPRGAWT